VFEAFNRLAGTSPEAAHIILDLIEAASRDHLLSGGLLIGLVQTDDNQYTCAPVGGRRVDWNNREWSVGDRGL
jgi:hypothetical protein